VSSMITRFFFSSRRRHTRSKRDWSSDVCSSDLDYNDPMTFLDMWLTDGSANRMDYSNEDYDEIIDEIREETDESERFDLMLEAEEMLMDEVEIVPLVQDADSILMRQNIEGMV